MRQIFRGLLAAILLFTCVPGHAIKTGQLQVVGRLQADTFVRIYSNTLAAPATSVTISGLNGDSDVEYLLKYRVVNGTSNNPDITLQFNGDASANYGTQILNGHSSTTQATRPTGSAYIYLSYSAGSGSGYIHTGEVKIYAKSGYIRTIISEFADGISGTTVTDTGVNGGVWNNTSDNITSMTILSDAAGNVIGVGSNFELYKRVSS